MAATTQISRWGNSLGLRLPKSVAREAQVDEGDTVAVSVRNGAIVIRPSRPTYSPRAYNTKARLAIACPITSQVKGYPFEVPLSSGGRIDGVILADHVKTLGWETRRVTFEAKAPSDTVSDVRERLRVLVGL
jgi:mRNA interferase MazF